MRKIFLFMMVTLDGYFEGPNHDISWHNVDQEFVEFAVQQLDEVDTLIMGRKTYELMYGFWPTDEAKKDDPETAKRMNGYRKIVFSHTLKESPWDNTEIYEKPPSKVINDIKAKPGKDVAVLASSNLCLSLLQDNLLDEIRIMINPVVIGSGTPLFAGIKKPLHLHLMSSRQFNSGNELLIYMPDR